MIIENLPVRALSPPPRGWGFSHAIFIEDIQLLPPYQYPYDWRTEVGTEPIGVKEETVSEARDAIVNMEKEIEANPDDPLVDELKVAIADTEKGIASVEEELAKGEKLQREITAREERNEELYEEWETEHSEELYDDLFC